MTDFALAQAAGGTAAALAEDCVAQLDASAGHSLGFVYVTSPLAAELGDIVEVLRSGTGVDCWVGTVGHGICATGAEYFAVPAVVAMTGSFEPGSFRLVPSTGAEPSEPPAAAGREGLNAGLAIVHADPRNGEVMNLVAHLAEQHRAFLVGGLTAAETAYPQVAGHRIVDGGVSGVLLGGRLDVAVGLTQGCSPVGPMHEVTGAEGQILATLDRQPAFEVLCEDVGIAEGADPRPWLANVHAALPVAGSDQADYVVRNLVGLDPAEGLVAVASPMQTGDWVMFVRRDAESAERDLDRMLLELAGRLQGPPKAGLYYSCVARGPNLFDEPAHELEAIRRAFGDIPVAGFFGNGEISNDKVYAYTGVLVLFS